MLLIESRVTHWWDFNVVTVFYENEMLTSSDLLDRRCKYARSLRYVYRFWNDNKDYHWRWLRG